MSWDSLKASVADVIKENGNNEITGELLQQKLFAIINNLGENYSYVGLATPSTTPTLSDGKTVYMATTSGTYTNFNSISLSTGEVAFLKWNGSWSKELLFTIAQVGGEITSIKQNGTTLDVELGVVNIITELKAGSNVASSTTTNIGAMNQGDIIHITGTTTITGFGASTIGIRRKVIFDSSLTLTYNATSMILPTSANIVTASGDTAEFICENATGYWRCLSYQRRNGVALGAGNASSVDGYSIWTGSQGMYDAIVTKDSNTLYFIL